MTGKHLDSGSAVIPPMEEQASFWNDWNLRFRKLSQSMDAYQNRQLETAKKWLSGGGEPMVLEIGCGTGWLTAGLATLGTLVGIDLSNDAIEEARRRGSSASFLAGDIVKMDFPGRFDMVITVDTMAHVPDHAAFIGKVSSVLEPGGIFLLMTQNSFVWNRSSQLMPLAKGQVRKWPQLAELGELLTRDFQIEQVSSIVPAGDRGILRLMNSRYCAGVLRKLLGAERQQALYEWLLIGKELVIVARRKG